MATIDPARTQETPEQVLERIRPIYDAVDIDNLSSDTQGTINLSELSGAKNTAHGIRILVLLQTEKIGTDDYYQLARLCL